MTEEEKNEIVGAIVFAKMEGAKFKINGVPLAGMKGKLNLYLVLMQDKKKIWELLLYKGVNRVANMTDLTQPDLNSTMPDAEAIMRRASEGDEEIYLKGRLT